MASLVSFLTFGAAFASGANPVATLENVNEEDFIGENPEWPLYDDGDGAGTRTNMWFHSTFREVAFYHTSKLNASLAAVGKPRVIIDTDLGSSMDDLFTIDLAARIHKQGKINLMAVMMDRPDNSDPEGCGEFLKSAQDATLQLPVQRIAEWQSGDNPIPVTLSNCVPGFYYSLFDGAAVTNIRAVQIEEDLNVLCGTEKKVVIPKVTKPIGGQNSGFFTIGVQETSDVEPGSEGKVPVPPVSHPGPQPYVH